jgi:hypothetical protein
MRTWLRSLLAAGSFVIYALAILVLHQERTNPFLAERGSLAAAVSSVVYHTPLGTADASVVALLRDWQTPIASALKKATQADASPRSLMQKGGADGNGIGYVVLATLAMHLFGPHPSSPILLMLVLMGISAAAFSWRFGDERALLVPLYFFSLTLMLFTPLVWDPNTAVGIPIGGIRYFALVAILPAFHLACEQADLTEPEPRIGQRTFLPLAMQVFILVAAILTRTSSAYLLGAIGVVWLLGLWRNRSDGFRVRRQLLSGFCMVGLGVGFFSVLIFLLPANYIAEGRVTGLVWHRAFISLGLNPAWPFGNLRDIYDCHHAPFPPGSGLEPGVLDRNGECVWFNYTYEHHLPPDVPNPAIYEKVMRDAFFNVLRLYPRQVLETYIYYKPPLVLGCMKQGIELDLNLNGYRLRLKCLLVMGFANLLVFLLIGSPASDPARTLRLCGITLLFALFSIPTYFFAWAGSAQTPDLRLYIIVAFGATLAALIEWGRRAAHSRLPITRYS